MFSTIESVAKRAVVRCSAGVGHDPLPWSPHLPHRAHHTRGAVVIWFCMVVGGRWLVLYVLVVFMVVGSWLFTKRARPARTRGGKWHFSGPRVKFVVGITIPAIAHECTSLVVCHGLEVVARWELHPFFLRSNVACAELDDCVWLWCGAHGGYRHLPDPEGFRRPAWRLVSGYFRDSKCSITAAVRGSLQSHTSRIASANSRGLCHFPRRASVLRAFPYACTA